MKRIRISLRSSRLYASLIRVIRLLQPDDRVSGSMLILNRQRQHAIRRRELRTFLERLSAELSIADREFAVVFITDEAIQAYNRIYRGFDKPTDVLSFEGDDG